MDNTCLNSPLNSRPTPLTSKWKSKKYQRSAREKRKREKSLNTDHLQQSIITSFFPIIDKVKKIINENENLRKVIFENNVFLQSG